MAFGLALWAAILGPWAPKYLKICSFGIFKILFSALCVLFRCLAKFLFYFALALLSLLRPFCLFVCFSCAAAVSVVVVVLVACLVFNYATLIKTWIGP